MTLVAVTSAKEFPQKFNRVQESRRDGTMKSFEWPLPPWVFALFVLASIFVTVLDGDGDGPPRKKQALMSKFFSKQPVPVPATLAGVTVSY